MKKILIFYIIIQILTAQESQDKTTNKEVDSKELLLNILKKTLEDPPKEEPKTKLKHIEIKPINTIESKNTESKLKHFKIE